MKNVLIITYYFPPLGGAGVQRTLKFIKYLPQFNYRPMILTPNPKLLRYHCYDHTLIKEIPKDTKIYNSFILDMNWIFKILYGLKLINLVTRLKKKFLFPDYEKQWIPFAKITLKKIMKKEKINIIYISSPPHSTQVLVKWIKSKFNLPIVSDFRDPFTFNYEKKQNGILKKYLDFEKSNLENCDFIIANTPINKKNYIEKFNIPNDRINVITNGFDKMDFENIGITQRQKNGKIIFSHIGQLYGEHNAEPLINALSIIKNKLEKVEFRFIGKVTHNDKKLVKKLELSTIVKSIDYCSHKEALKYNQESDFLVIILSNHNWDYCIPGKTFEYINSGKKILAIVPENGSCAEVIRKTKTGIVVSPDKPDEIANIILKFIAEYKEQDYDFDLEEIMKYERKYLTGNLASIFTKLLEKK